MTHPYTGLDDSHFWTRGIARVERHKLNPCGPVKFTIRKSDRIISAGSCFAQVVAKVLQANGFNYLVAEDGADLPEAERVRRNYSVYSARYGNLYTPRQLVQLLDEAFGGPPAAERVWIEPDGRVLDPYRPTIEPEGFASEAELIDSRAVMLDAVRRMVRAADVFVYTLGITEGWRSRIDGRVFPLVPGAQGGTFDEARHEFVNFRFAEALDDVSAAFDLMKRENPGLKVLLTLSPVQMMATFENAHVLTASTEAKSVLRAVAGEVARDRDWVQYFPSYELMTGSYAAGMYYNDDMRTINEAGVAHVVRALFASVIDPQDRPAARAEVRIGRDITEVVCDEEVMGQTR